jgi:hypothetical protein
VLRNELYKDPLRRAELAGAQRHDFGDDYCSVVVAVLVVLATSVLGVVVVV